MAAAAAAGLESPGAYSESLGDQDDVVYPCKGCGEILEEGKAFELANNRWHINCFRCNTCNTLLDSDANLLLLGDGSLICNNCTYSCNACGNKIEDLAILTGDQAFCASCFRCRNCKRKIENLRYARTSQGIFCMSCHETLMARRRKKAKGSSRQAQAGAGSTSEKALPSLPSGIDPSAVAFSPETETPLSTYSDPKSPPERSDRQLGNSPATFDTRTTSPHLDDVRKDAQTLPSSTYSDGRPSNVSDDPDDGTERGYLPMAFDPNPARPPPVASVSRKQVPRNQESASPAQGDRDYFGKSGKRDTESTASASSSRETAAQEKSSTTSKPNESATPVASPHVGTPSSRANSTADAFKLQEAPKVRKPGTRGNSTAGDALSPAIESLVRNDRLERSGASASPTSADSQLSGINPFDDPKRNDDRPAPSRGESLATNNPKPDSTPTVGASSRHDRKASSASFAEGLPRNDSRPKPDEPVRSSIDAPPPRSASRPTANKSTPNGDFVAPRAPPQPPTSSHKQQESIDASSVSEDHDSLRNSGLPKHNVDGPFNMEEEMARILRGDNHSKRDADKERTEYGMLRRVSNAVKHGRSFSDRVSNTGSKSPNNGSQIEISSPIAAVGGSSISSPTSQTALDQLRAQLKRAHLRIAELEADKNGLQEKFDSSAHISAASKELSDKRNTMVVLDAQREMVVAELESMTKHLKRAKDSNKPLDLNLLKSDILRDFSDELQKVKDRTAAEIEKLILERNQLTDEIGQLIQMKDKGFQEYESVSSKNSQLLELNAQLVHNIQEMYKAGAQPKHPSKDLSATMGGANGLGIYGSRPASDTPGPQADHAEPAAMVSAPQVVDIRKGGAKKFNWRKGGEKVAKNVTRGIKGMLAGEQVPTRDGPSPQGDIGLPYHMMQAAGGSEQNSAAGSRPDMNKIASTNSFGLFGQKNGAPKTGSGNKDSSTNLAADASVLFGSELEARCEFEKRVVPSIVSRCIEEVELRGMTLEGIYRKSGGSSQVKTVQTGFEKDGNYDISDEDLDIHAVTSALKQYLRRLPTPLITYDAYDSVLDAGQIQDKEKQAAALRAAVADLPDAHRSCLEYLFQHLGRVVQHESDNLMTPLNVSVVFAPTIMRPLSIEREMSDMQAQRHAVQALLEHQRIVFGE